MQVIERDVLVDPNESGDYWYIPVVFYEPTDMYRLLSLGSNTLTVSAFTVSDSNSSISASAVACTDWLQPSGNSNLYVLCVPTETEFLQDLTVYIELIDTSGESDEYAACPITIHIRKMTSGGGGSSAPTTAQIAQAVWNYYVEEPSSGVVGTRTLSSVSDIAQAVWNYSVAEPASGTLGTRTLSTTVEVNPSAIAEAVWNYAVAEPASGTLGTRTLTTAIPTASNIATAVLTTDVSDEPVETDEYTLKHLVMASQRSKVVTENGETVWKIMGNRLSGETGEEIVIATRTLTLNTNGAITQTM